MTKSPWVPQKLHGGSVEEYEIYDARGNKIGGFVDPVAVNLIHPAPDLLEALEAMVKLCHNASKAQGFSFTHFKECQLANLAIAKAKGEQA